jgi:hypothetical protein
VTRADDRETGAYLILYALLGVAMFTLAAVVLDLAALRQGRSADRHATDLAAAAGAAEIDGNDPSSYAQACEAAWGYLLANRNGSVGGVTPPDCPAQFPAVVCDPTVPRTALADIGPDIDVEITNPVPDDSVLMRAEVQGADLVQSVDPAVDGDDPCERLAVRVVRRRTLLFGPVAGTTAGTTDVHSVARATIVTSAITVPSVVALEPSGCDAVTTAGPATDVWIGGTLGATTRQGLLVVDSTGASCAAPGFVIDTADRRLTVDGGGTIASQAVTAGNVARAYDAGDVPAYLSPLPGAAVEPLGRGFVDRRYHCVGPGCAPGSDPIGDLRSGPSSLAGPGLPPSIALTYPLAPATCTAGPGATVVAGDVWVDCAPFVVPNGSTVTFTGARVVVRGGVLIEPGGRLVAGSSAPGSSTVVFFQGGDFVRQSDAGAGIVGRFDLTRTMVYLADPSGTGAEGRLLIGSDDTGPNSTWTAPTGGPLEDLLLWAESSGDSLIDDTFSASGTFFLPNATLQLHDQSFDFEAQLVVRRLRVVGPEDLRIFTNPGRATGALVRVVRLIR